jgi:mono/diheme cytochrome c family protein
MKRIYFVIGLATAACTGDTGPTGPIGPMGTNGTNGTNGTDGMNGSNGSNGNDVIISDRAKHGLDISPVAVNTTGMTSAQIEAIGQGSYLVNAVADCGACHGEAGTTPGFLAGTTATGAFNARNLTPDAASGMKLTKAQFVDVMQTGNNYACDAAGCTSAGNTLKVMPWLDYRWASTSDLEAIYAYVKAIPGVSNLVAADTGTHGPAATAMPTTFVDGAFARTLPAEKDAMGNPIPDPDAIRRGMVLQPLTAVTSLDATTDARIGRGSYLINAIARCYNCHSNPGRTTAAGTPLNTATWLSGGATGARVFTIVGVVRSMPANLVGATHGFFGELTSDFTTFEGIIQTGTHVDDATAPPLAAPMPWQHLRLLTVDDLASIYTYLHGVWTAQPAPDTGDSLTQDASFYCAANTDCDQAGGETCDLDNTSMTYHECIGRACTVNTDCRVCQTCSGTNTCGAPLGSGCTHI